MESLQILVEMVQDLPAMAMWLIIAFFVYKISILGSVYAVIRYVCMRVTEYLQARTAARKEVELAKYGQEIISRYDISDEVVKLCIDSSYPQLLVQLKRLTNSAGTVPTDYSFLHTGDIVWLKQAIDEKIERDKRDKV